jgi:hypothetical protein
MTSNMKLKYLDKLSKVSLFNNSQKNFKDSIISSYDEKEDYNFDKDWADEF